MTKEQIKQLFIANELSLLVVIDVLIEVNNIKGVELLSLGEKLKAHCIGLEYQQRQREEHVVTPIDELIAIQRENAAKSFVKELRVTVPIKTHAINNNVVQEFDDAYEKWDKQRQAENVQSSIISMYDEMSLNELVLYAYDYLGVALIHTFTWSKATTKEELLVLLRKLVIEKHVEYKKEVAKYAVNNIDSINAGSLISVSHMYTYCKLPLNTMYKQFSTELANEIGVDVITLQDNLFNGIFQVLTKPNDTYNMQKTTLAQKLQDLQVILDEYKQFSVQNLKNYL